MVLFGCLSRKEKGRKQPKPHRPGPVTPLPSSFFSRAPLLSPARAMPGPTPLLSFSPTRPPSPLLSLSDRPSPPAAPRLPPPFFLPRCTPAVRNPRRASPLGPHAKAASPPYKKGTTAPSNPRPSRSIRWRSPAPPPPCSAESPLCLAVGSPLCSTAASPNHGVASPRAQEHFRRSNSNLVPCGRQNCAGATPVSSLPAV
jgi:hypothetical protein